MIRTLLAYFFAWLAQRLIRSTEPVLEAPTHLRPTRPDPPLATLATDRVVRQLPNVELARADGVLGYVLGNEVSGLMFGHFTKTPDTRWRQ